MKLMRTKNTILKNGILSIFVIFASTHLWADQIQNGTQADTSQLQSLQALQNKIESYLLTKLADQDTQGTIKVAAGNIDSRLKLRICADDKLEIFNPYGNALINTTTIGIKCTEKVNHWTLYVPVKITILKRVLVTKNALTKGTLLKNDDFYAIEMDAQKLKQGYFTDANQVAGLVCKKEIAPETVLNPYNVELAKIVFKGQEVHIIATSGNLKISMGGIAMSDGALGDVIKVQNATSKKVIEAQISGKKQVTVTL